MKLKRGVINIIVSLVGQLVVVAFGLIIPRILITDFSSDYNGLISSVSQVISYFILFDAGVGVASIQALYMYLAKNDRSTVSQIILTSRKYYRRVGLGYFAAICILTIAYTFLGDGGLDKLTIATVVATQGLIGLISFAYNAPFVQLLTAEGKDYAITAINTSIAILMNVARIIVLLTWENIILMQLVALGIAVLQMTIYSIFFKRKYKWVDMKCNTDTSLLSHRKSYFYHQISSLIFNSTDIIILTIFSGYLVVSVYSIYGFTISAVSTIVVGIAAATSFMLGDMFHKDFDKYIKLHDLYTAVYTTFSTAMYSVCLLLFIPFIRIYTAGADINYVYTSLPVLFCTINILSNSRHTSNMLINFSGNAPHTVSRSIAESCINLSVSLLLVNFIGIYGVLIGTIVAMIYRVNDIILYANKLILHRKPIKDYTVWFSNLVLFAIVVLINTVYEFNIQSAGDFILHGLIITPIMLLLFFGVSLMISKKDYQIAFDYFKRNSARARK